MTQTLRPVKPSHHYSATPHRRAATPWVTAGSSPAWVVIRGRAFGQNLRRGHYELGAETRNDHLRVAAAFDELTEAI